MDLDNFSQGIIFCINLFRQTAAEKIFEIERVTSRSLAPFP
jgi:hypothetical protein